ncbi:hypothetical protein F2Q68_00025323 [Brassica cretica]|uniref:Uncharacterized protein n=1 Tax=Brassica cretica TaxID=69181 RepID=A0A8S9I808_BRACR|nr:hypothetical protein F2Q68_00025323 [Brassica cretica]
MGSNVATTSSMPDRNTGGSTRLPPPPPPSGSGAGTNIPSGGRTSASVFQARVSTPSTDEYQRTDADPAALRTNLARSLRTNERPISPASWEDDRARSHQEPARRVSDNDPNVLPFEGPDAIRRYMPSITRSNKETQLLFSLDPASLERSIRKEARSSSTDNITCVTLDSAQPPLTQTLVPSTDSRSPLSTDNTHLPSTNILHNNGDLHDQEGHLRNAAGQRIDAQGAAILEPDANATGRYVASGGLTGRYVASGSKRRKVLLVFVVKSQRKLRLRRNEERYDEESKENTKERNHELVHCTSCGEKSQQGFLKNCGVCIGGGHRLKTWNMSVPRELPETNRF